MKMKKITSLVALFLLFNIAIFAGTYSGGAGTSGFTGSYDGQGGAIAYLNTNRPESSCVGLFGLLDGGVVKNLWVYTNTFVGKYYVGAIAGQTLNAALIENCFVTSALDKSIEGVNFVGGVVGSLDDGSVINRSGAVADVNGQKYVGGLVGRNLATVTDCYASGNVNGTISNEGGLVGGNTSTPIVSNSFWDTETSGQASSAGGTGKTTAEMTSLATYTSTSTSGLSAAWDFVGTPNDDTGIADWWNMDEPGSFLVDYPFPSYIDNTNNPTGSGTEVDPYQIANLNNLYWLTQTSAAWGADVYFEQTADIAVYSTAYIGFGKGFLPIALGSSFQASYNGQGHTITGLYIDQNESFIGFFSRIMGTSGTPTVITDLHLRDVDITNTQGWTVGLFGISSFTTILRCSCTGTVQGVASVGLLAGILNPTANIIEECWTAGTVSGTDRVGGLIGQCGGANIELKMSDCYSRADVSGNDNFGGLIGYILHGVFTGLTIENCYSTGTVTGSSNIGGLFGYEDPNFSLVTLTANFWDMESSGLTDGVGNLDPDPSGVTGKTTNAMKTESISSWGWSTDIWERIGYNYPRLSENTDPTLPVTLSTFTAQFLENTPTLYWETQSETDNMGWFIYRNEENDFSSSEVISDLIEGHGTTTEQQNYIYEDSIENPEIQDTCYYWLESIDYSGMVHHYDKVAVLTIPNQDDPGSGLIPEPERYGLLQNEPNPMISSTDIAFNLHEMAQVKLDIYNLKGQLVKSLYTGMTDSQSIAWDGSDNKGRKLSAGVYLYKLIVNDKTKDTKKLILMK